MFLSTLDDPLPGDEMLEPDEQTIENENANLMRFAAEARGV